MRAGSHFRIIPIWAENTSMWRLFRHLSLLLAPLLLLGCQSTQPAPGKELVEAYFAAAFAKDYARLDELLHEDFIFIGPKRSDTLDKKALINSWRSTHLRNDSLRMHDPRVYDVSAQETLNRDESLILHYYEAEFHNSDLKTWVEFPVHVKFLTHRDKIKRAQIIMNQSDVQTQLGYTILPPKE